MVNPLLDYLCVISWPLMAPELSILLTGRICRSMFSYRFGRTAERVQTFLGRVLPLFNSGVVHVRLVKLGGLVLAQPRFLWSNVQ